MLLPVCFLAIKAPSKKVIFSGCKEIAPTGNKFYSFGGFLSKKLPPLKCIHSPLNCMKIC